MRIYKADDYKELSRKAANIISAQIIIKPDCVLGLATGSSPVGTYDQLIEWYEKGDLDFSEVRTVNLDEYKGLAKGNEQSYSYFMRKHLFNHVNILPENTHIPDGLAEDEEKECMRYNAEIRSMGGVDMQLLGIGANAHIGFNEPGEDFKKETHCVELKESTIEANSRFFTSKEDVPRKAYSMGIKSIMNSKAILLIASGDDKADAVYKMICGPITSNAPASILQLHNNVYVVADEAALEKVSREYVIEPNGTIL